MYRALDASIDDAAWARWRDAAAAAVGARLGDDLMVVVADDPDMPGRLVSCGAGTISGRLPNPWRDDALVGYVQWMSTEPAFQRGGLARTVLARLLDWFAARGVVNVELHASPQGEPLYRAAGFWAGRGGVAMRRRPWDPPPDPGSCE